MALKTMMEIVIVTFVSIVLAGIIFSSRYILPVYGLQPSQIQAVVAELSH